MNNLSDIDHTLYINLDTRTDKNQNVLQELNNIGFKNPTRYNAIKLPNGAIGCSMSHLNCLIKAKNNNWEHVCIVEDDIQFTNPDLFKTQLNTFLTTHSNWDILLLAGNNVSPYLKVDDTCIKVSHCQTTTGYIIKSHYYDTLIHNIKEGILYLLKEPTKHILYAIDKYWLSLQKIDNWYLLIPLTVIQRIGYSDIEKRNTDYSKLLLNVDKPLYKSIIKK